MLNSNYESHLFQPNSCISFDGLNPDSLLSSLHQFFEIEIWISVHNSEVLFTYAPPPVSHYHRLTSGDYISYLSSSMSLQYLLCCYNTIFVVSCQQFFVYFLLISHKYICDCFFQISTALLPFICRFSSEAYYCCHCCQRHQHNNHIRQHPTVVTRFR